MRLPVVRLLHLGRLREALVVVQDRLGEARGAAGEVDRGVLVGGERHARVRRGAQARQLAVALRPGGAVVAHEEEQAPRLDAVHDLLNAPDELRAKDEDVHVGLVQAVGDLVRGVAEVQRHHRGARLEHAKVEREPLDAVVEQDGDLVVLADAAAEQQVGKAVGLLVKDGPGHLAAERLVVGGLHQVVVAPGDVAVLAPLGVDLHEGHLAGVLLGVGAQHVDDGHGSRAFRSCRSAPMIAVRAGSVSGLLHARDAAA